MKNACSQLVDILSDIISDRHETNSHNTKLREPSSASIESQTKIFKRQNNASTPPAKKRRFSAEEYRKFSREQSMAWKTENNVYNFQESKRANPLKSEEYRSFPPDSSSLLPNEFNERSCAATALAQTTSKNTNSISQQVSVRQFTAVTASFSSFSTLSSSTVLASVDRPNSIPRSGYNGYNEFIAQRTKEARDRGETVHVSSLGREWSAMSPREKATYKTVATCQNSPSGVAVKASKRGYHEFVALRAKAARKLGEKVDITSFGREWSNMSLQEKKMYNELSDNNISKDFMQ
ncbi:hypothetical protein HK100_010175 [Physocladia obscura]|uniref:Uncharacterized protein n=1 Tax=Physocladia obscura TaxID=109957 RepID=A0AAD5SN25_9FUNG|nr:hypothetical protein HK100_010175 [Physocladia obscura]